MNWLSGARADETRSLLQLYPADLMSAEAYPLPPRKAGHSIGIDGQPCCECLESSTIYPSMSNGRWPLVACRDRLMAAQIR